MALSNLVGRGFYPEPAKGSFNIFGSFVGRGFSRDIRNASDKFSFRRIFRRAFRPPSLSNPSLRHPVEPAIIFEVLVGNFHISEISTSKNVCRVVDSFPARSYNRFAKAFESSDSS
jgi:hypothetical protein